MEKISSKVSYDNDAKMADDDDSNYPEESSWTFYIEGFRCDDDDRISCHSSEYESPSLVSDAASSPVRKFTNTNCTENYNNNNNNSIGFSYGKNSRTICKQNSFKIINKQKAQKVLPAVDYDLEDTASSPVNSPKISYLNDQFMNLQKEKGKMDFSELVKRNIFSKKNVLATERDSDTLCTDLEIKKAFG